MKLKNYFYETPALQTLSKYYVDQHLLGCNPSACEAC